MKKKILIVDDSLFLREMLRDILEKNGYEICGEATDGKEAIEMYKKLKPDMVTMDIIMPQLEELDGISAVKNILAFDPKAKIIMVSVMDQDDLVQDALSSGAKDFIVKPFLPSNVLEKIKKVLNSD